MANGNCESAGDQAKVLELFQAGQSKAEIARGLQITRDRVKKLLAMAIRSRTHV